MKTEYTVLEWFTCRGFAPSWQDAGWHWRNHN